MELRLIASIIVAFACGSPPALADDALPVCIIAEQPSWSVRYLDRELSGNASFDSTSLIIDGRAELSPEWKRCEVLILVDVSPATLRRQPELVAHIPEFLARGGGLVVASSGAWGDEEFPLHDLLPVLPARGELKPRNAPALSRPSITGAGLRSLVLRLVEDPMRNQQLWREELTPCFGEPLPVLPHKEATILAVDPARQVAGEDIPLIATRDVGEGRVIFLNNCQAWRWRIKPVGNYHQRFWKQLTRYAAGHE